MEVKVVRKKRLVLNQILSVLIKISKKESVHAEICLTVQLQPGTEKNLYQQVRC